MNKVTIKPMNLWKSLLYFGIPGVMLYWNIYYGVPLLAEYGVPLIVSFPLALYGLLGLLFFASLIAYKLEGNPMTWSHLKQRFRLHKVTKKLWIAALVSFLVLQIFEACLKFTGALLAEMPFFAPPSVLPEFIHPHFELVFPFKEFMGVPLDGNWWIILVWLLCLLCNILGEEFWWRGYILPRQELAFGRYAWLVQGVLWLFLFHAFLKWNFIVLIPTCLLIPYLAQKYQNTWLAAIVHGIGNALFFVFIIPGIF